MVEADSHFLEFVSNLGLYYYNRSAPQPLVAAKEFGTPRRGTGGIKRCVSFRCKIATTLDLCAQKITNKKGQAEKEFKKKRGNNKKELR